MEPQPSLSASSSASSALSAMESANSRRRALYTVVATLAGLATTVFLVASSSSSQQQQQKALSSPSLRTSMLSSSGKTASSSTRYASLEGTEKKALFDSFMDEFGKSYASDNEKDLRYANFKAFLKLIDERNDKEAAAKNTAVHGVTQFADLSEEEVRQYLLGYKATDRRRLKFKATAADVPKYEGSETAVNWADVYTTNVRDQGYCGSCWAYSTAEQMESDGIRAGYLTTSDKLSVQQMVSCDTVDLGCNGGNTETAYEYVNGAGGLMLEASYPYTSYFDISGTCSVTSSSEYAVTVDKYYTVGSEDDMVDYVLGNGPLSICAAASSWTSYKGGVVSSCDDEVDHCIQVTGVDTDQNYWIVRNSWGKSWGNDGYIYLETGKNMCAISNDPTYTQVSLVSRR